MLIPSFDSQCMFTNYQGLNNNLKCIIYIKNMFIASFNAKLQTQAERPKHWVGYNHSSGLQPILISKNRHIVITISVTRFSVNNFEFHFEKITVSPITQPTLYVFKQRTFTKEPETDSVPVDTYEVTYEDD